MRGLLTFAILLGACGNSPGAGTDGGGDDAPLGDDGGPGDDGSVDDGMTEDGPPISTCLANTWCQEDVPAGVTGLIHGVDALAANDVFAVGDGGLILRRQNGAWTKMTSGSTENLRAVFALAANDVWAAGQNSTILHYNGTSWSAISGAPASISFAGVWGAATNDVWFVGTNTGVHWTGAALASPESVITGTPVSISGTATNDVWVAAENGKVSHFTTSWTLCGGSAACAVPTGIGNSFYAVGARANNDVWASVPGTGTIRWNGATWTEYSTDTTLFGSIYAPGANNAWGVGSTKVGHWDGQAWTISAPIAGFSHSLYGISGVGPHTWAVGDSGSILYHHD